MVLGEMSIQLVTFAGSLVSSLNLINQVFLRILALVSLLGWLSVRAIGRPYYATSLMRGSFQNEIREE